MEKRLKVGEKTFECQYCPCIFATPRDLNLHLKAFTYNPLIHKQLFAKQYMEDSKIKIPCEKCEKLRNCRRNPVFCEKGLHVFVNKIFNEKR